MPLYGRLFSHAVGGHASENEEIRDAIKAVAEVVGQRGVWVMDQGGDCRHLYYYLLPNKHVFIIR